MSASETAIPSTGAAPCRREAVLTTSPVTMPSPSSGRAPSATTASPVSMPMRTWSARVGSASFSSSIASRMRSPARTARSASSSCAVGSAEDGHDRVPDELLDRAPVALDLLPQARVVRADARTDVLGVSGFRGGGEADEVAEEDGHDLALLLDRGRRLLGQWRSTERAEGELAGELPTAGRAGRHARSLGRLMIGDGSVASSDIPAHSRRKAPRLLCLWILPAPSGKNALERCAIRRLAVRGQYELDRQVEQRA